VYMLKGVKGYGLGVYGLGVLGFGVLASDLRNNGSGLRV
jgi:hypothetical protein